MTWIVILLVGAFLLGLKFIADLIKTRPRKYSISNHLGVPIDAIGTPPSDASQRRSLNPLARIRTLYLSVR